MNKLLKSLVLTLLISSSLFAQIIESKKMSEILNKIQPDSLVIFDLDNTIMEAGQTVGSDQWFEHRIKQHVAAGLTQEKAVETTVEEWQAVNYKGRVQLVEKNTPQIIESIQDRGIPTMGLTARPHTFMNESLSQLRRLGVHLDDSTISHDIITIQDKDKAVFKDGLMSVGGNNKGTILVALLEKVGLRPGNIIFVDDKVKNVTNVDNALVAASLPSFAFRYGAADEKVAAFDAKLADFQFDYFVKTGVVLTDKQARKLMK